MKVKVKTRNSAINNLAFGAVILGWGILLLLRRVGIIEKNVSTWSYPFVAFGALLIASGIIKLGRLRHLKETE